MGQESCMSHQTRLSCPFFDEKSQGRLSWNLLFVEDRAMHSSGTHLFDYTCPSCFFKWLHVKLRSDRSRGMAKKVASDFIAQVMAMIKEQQDVSVNMTEYQNLQPWSLCVGLEEKSLVYFASWSLDGNDICHSDHSRFDSRKRRDQHHHFCNRNPVWATKWKDNNKKTDTIYISQRFWQETWVHPCLSTIPWESTIMLCNSNIQQTQ